ncbi:MAG: molybdopterin-dependent oxidoreductase [Dehalococcoidales bacterium]
MASLPKINRRQFVKASGATVATVALGKALFDWRQRPLLTKAADSGPVEEKWMPTTCWIGKQECGILARVVDGRIVKLEGHPDHPRNLGKLCVKGQAQLMSIYDPYRIKAPLLRTNGKGQPGEWREISWDDALTRVGTVVKDVIARDKRLLMWQKGRSKAGGFYDNAFVKASGATKVGHGGYCSDAAYRSLEYTFGFHGGIHPDFHHCKYLLSYGWGLTSAGGNKFCWLTWPRQFVEARERGMKVVSLDPRRRGMGPHTDAWLPIKPGTDLAFFLSLVNVLIERDTIDRPYLARFTNAPFLVGSDGKFVREGGKELVWDTDSGSARPHDEPGISPALEGSYVVNGQTAKTSFQLLKESVASHTTQWAASVCDLPAKAIRRVGEELGDNAHIGETIVIDGIELPYRPVGVMAYHVAQQELGFQAFRAMSMVFMLLGAVEAVGGPRIDLARSIHKNFEGLDNITIKDKPDNIYLKNSRFYPINSANPGIYVKAMLDPAKYGVDYIPEVMIIHMANPLLSFLEQDAFIEAYKKLKFVAVIDPFMSETADYFADVVLPAATIEKYEGPNGVSDQYVDATTIRMPPIPPLYQSRGEIDIYLDLCEKAGILYGGDGYIAKVNSELKLTGANVLDLNSRPDVRDIFDRWARSSGYPGGIRFFEENGVAVTPFTTKQLYAPAWDEPYGGIKHRMYGESLLGYQEEMKAKGSTKAYWQDYTPLPVYRAPTMNGSPSEYDMTLISYKKVEFKQSRTTFNALLLELEPEQRAQLNRKTAETKGIEDGDVIWVESHNAVTGATKRVQAKAELIEGIRPDTLAMSHHYGFWVHPGVKDNGSTPNALFFTGEGYVANTADQSFHVRVKVTRA